MRYLFACSLLFLVVIGLHSSVAFGDTSDSVPAVVKIGVCGDGVAEGVEDCDNADLLGNTCESLDYASGALSCDPSCSFDETLCVPKPPPVDPPEEPDDEGEEEDVAPDNDGNVNEDDNDDDEEDQDITAMIETFIQQITELGRSMTMPEFLKIFDVNSDGKILADELFASAQIWFDDWKASLTATRDPQSNVLSPDRSCDLNKDQRCDLVDFSILMYHMDRY